LFLYEKYIFLILLCILTFYFSKHINFNLNIILIILLPFKSTKIIMKKSNNKNKQNVNPYYGIWVGNKATGIKSKSKHYNNPIFNNIIKTITPIEDKIINEIVSNNEENNLNINNLNELYTFTENFKKKENKPEVNKEFELLNKICTLENEKEQQQKLIQKNFINKMDLRKEIDISNKQNNILCSKNNELQTKNENLNSIIEQTNILMVPNSFVNEYVEIHNENFEATIDFFRKSLFYEKCFSKRVYLNNETHKKFQENSFFETDVITSANFYYFFESKLGINNRIIEIGPGTCRLSGLLSLKNKLDCLEIDHTFKPLYQTLKKKNLIFNKIQFGDFLDKKPEYFNNNYDVLVWNIPYKNNEKIFEKFEKIKIPMLVIANKTCLNTIEKKFKKVEAKKINKHNCFQGSIVPVMPFPVFAIKIN
jgi:hypothetical protein